MLEEQARRARKLQADALSAEDFAQFLDLPLTDTLARVHSLFDQVNALVIVRNNVYMMCTWVTGKRCTARCNSRD